MRTLDADVSLLNIKTPARNSGPGMQSVRPVNDSQTDYRGYNPQELQKLLNEDVNYSTQRMEQPPDDVPESLLDNNFSPLPNARFGKN